MSSSLGINRNTGLPLADLDHVRQSLSVIFTTRIGQRVMRRTFGSMVPGLLGKELTPQTLMRFYMSIVIAVYLWEPRFSVTSASYPGTTPSGLSQGQFGVTLNGNYMPNALTGDFTIASTISVVV